MLNYTLVYWEDAEAVAGEELRLSQHSLEGYLYYKNSTKKAYSYKLFHGASWKYFVLEWVQFSFVHVVKEVKF